MKLELALTTTGDYARIYYNVRHKNYNLSISNIDKIALDGLANKESNLLKKLNPDELVLKYDKYKIRYIKDSAYHPIKDDLLYFNGRKASVKKKMFFNGLFFKHNIYHKVKKTYSIIYNKLGNSLLPNGVQSIIEDPTYDFLQLKWQNIKSYIKVGKSYYIYYSDSGLIRAGITTRCDYIIYIP